MPIDISEHAHGTIDRNNDAQILSIELE